MKKDTFTAIAVIGGLGLLAYFLMKQNGSLQFGGGGGESGGSGSFIGSQAAAGDGSAAVGSSAKAAAVITGIKAGARYMINVSDIPTFTQVTAAAVRSGEITTKERLKILATSKYVTPTMKVSGLARGLILRQRTLKKGGTVSL